MEKEEADLGLLFLPPSAVVLAHVPQEGCCQVGMPGSWPSDVLEGCIHTVFFDGICAQFHFTSSGGLLCCLLCGNGWCEA